MARIDGLIARSGVLVDAKVLLDVITEAPDWEPRSSRALSEAADRAVVVINPLVDAEPAGSFGSAADLERYVGASEFLREALPWEAAYLAGRAYIAYCRRGGRRSAPLPDFYIGAHAAVRGSALLTRDTARYHTYFPAVPLIAP